MGFEPGIFRPLFRVRTKAPPVAGSWRRICWQLRAVPRGQSGRKALWARARARARSLYHHGTHPLTKSAERRASAAPSMQARLVCLRRCASARRWLPVQLVADAAGRRAWGWATSKGTRSGSSSSSSPGKSEMRFTGEPDEIQPRPSASEARASLPFQDTKNRKRRPANAHLRRRHRIRRNFCASPRAKRFTILEKFGALRLQNGGIRGKGRWIFR